ncbi:hypothetical protein [Hymenobacter weizhouensis]|uniref:hypothetical protein n=1 Tax=Hymenobacter sp. YIM 151500-1 TaxID=2987689 RepID=UPI0022280B38|nr:hypothetical protein [Hymenobacter sp. YIM 151500-1]UYZ64688.1 hypothetical protein OIS53_07520 [Hymenobacter sp. YIM 151500-1]
MLKKPLLLLPLACASVAAAQTKCAVPVLKLLRNGQEIPATGSAPAPTVTLQVAAEPGCPSPASYRFRQAQATLVRQGRPVLPALLITQPQADLTPLLRAARPGDQVYVFIPYGSLVTVAADGKQQPYQPPQAAPSRTRPLDLQTDQAKGINFVWKLVRE